MSPERAPASVAIERRRLLRGALRLGAFVAAVVLAVILLPGLGHVRHLLANVSPGWLALAGALEVLSSLSYVAIFHPVFCPRVPWRISYRIGMAEVGVTALLPVAGAGGLALGAWALHRRGMPPERIASRTVAFFLLTSAVNAVALVLLGLGLASGILPGAAPLGLTLVPALVAGAGIAAVLALPWFAQRRGGIASRSPRRRLGVLVVRAVRSLTAGLQDGLLLLRSGSPLVYVGAIGYWAFDNAVLWVCFRALGHAPSVAVVGVAYLIGQIGAAVPLPAGAGAVDLGLIGTLVLFHVPAAAATAAALSYRAFQLWVPALMGGVALARLPGVLAIDEQPASG